MNSTILSASRTLTSNLNSPFEKYFTVGYPFTLNRDPISGSFVASKAASTPGICRKFNTFSSDHLRKQLNRWSQKIFVLTENDESTQFLDLSN